MADNYLERKMEELRSGAPRKSVHKVASLGCRPGIWEVPFAERRVVVAGNGSDLDVMMVEQLRSVGCKVAFMGGGKKDGNELACRTGAQFHPTKYDDWEGLMRSVALVCRAWGDIDVVICTVEHLPVPLLEAWNNYRNDKPYPNSYGGRIITVNGAGLPENGVLEALKAHGIEPVEVRADEPADAVAAAMMAMVYRFRVCLHLPL